MFVASGHGLTEVINPSQAAASTAASKTQETLPR